MITCDRTQVRHYEHEGARYYSVSQVLDVLHGQPHWGSQEAMDRGTYLHRLFALSVGAFAGLCEPPAIPTEYMGYAESWTHWLTIAKPEPLAIEQRLVSTMKGLPFAGTPDLLCWMLDKNKRVRVLVDLKSGAKEKWHRVQVQAYGKLCTHADRLALLYIDKDGGLPTWQIVKPDPRDWAGFQHALALLQYREGL